MRNRGNEKDKIQLAPSARVRKDFNIGARDHLLAGSQIFLEISGDEVCRRCNLWRSTRSWAVYSINRTQNYWKEIETWLVPVPATDKLFEFLNNNSIFNSFVIFNSNKTCRDRKIVLKIKYFCFSFGWRESCK